MTLHGITRVAFRVRGRVQGVSYRASAQHMATSAGLRGWVRNDYTSGEVEGVVEGEQVTVEEFLSWCERGPRGARVDAVLRAEDDSGEPLVGFEVRR